MNMRSVAWPVSILPISSGCHTVLVLDRQHGVTWLMLQPGSLDHGAQGLQHAERAVGQ